MKKTGILMLGAVPGVALGYLALTALLLGRVRPVPITFLPEDPIRESERSREAVTA